MTQPDFSGTSKATSTAVGQRVRNVDWEARTSGGGPYAGDVRLPGALVAKILRSPHPHARIRTLDTSVAEQSDGVRAVISAADFGDALYIHHGGPLSDRPPLARDVVRFVGQEVAAVAAETTDQADRALELIRVEYEVLPAATTIHEALADGAPRIHERVTGTNVSVPIERNYGDLEAARARVAVEVSARYRWGRQAHACMEPNSVLARWDPEAARLDLWTSTQAPYFIRKEVAHALGLELDQVRTHEVAVGGGFGSKSKISEHEVIAAKLAMRADRPVRLILDRAEEFSTTKCRHAFDIELTTGAEADGTLAYRDARVLVDNGAYNHSGPSVMGYGSLVLGSLYRTGAVRIDARLVDTNKHPGGQFRGYGGPQVTFAMECQMDELAERLGIDPIDLRIRNANQAGDVTHAGWRISSAALRECLEAVRREIGWDEKRRHGGTGRGVGVAAAIHVTGAHVYEGAERADAAVDVGADGRVRVRFGGADAGTGQKTILAQVAAQTLGVDLGAVEVLSMDSARTPEDLGPWSSRGTFMSGHAVARAARAAAERLRRIAGGKLGVEPAAVRLEGGEATSGRDRIPIGDLVAMAEEAVDGELRFEETFLADIEPVNPATGVSHLSPTYSFAAHAVEVEVDAATGLVRVLDVVAAHDCGVPINPTAVESQIIGGVVMGVGAALGEELLYEGGRIVNPAYINYALPRAADVPPVRTVLIGQPDPSGPFGAKGVGEISIIPTAAAVANAVAHAVGVRIRELPITPDKVLTMLRERDGRPRRAYHLWRRPRRWWVSFVRWAYARGLHALLDRYGTRLARGPSGSVGEPIREILLPTSLPAAVEVLAERPEAAAIGGGTDLLPARQQGLRRPIALLDLRALPELHQVVESKDGSLRIGGGVTLADLHRRLTDLPDEGLRDTIQRIASAQIREMATVAGNLCQEKRCWFYRNGFDCYKRGGVTCPCYAVLGDHRFYHAALGAHRCQAVTPSDLATTLTALDADVLVRGRGGERMLTMERFYRGPGEPGLDRGEIVVDIRIPAAARRRVTRFEKLRLWEGDFAVVSSCVSVATDSSGRVTDSRIAIGAIAPTPYRARRSERVLAGADLDERTIARAAAAWLVEGHPLPRNEWKLDAAAGLVRRCLESCARARGVSSAGMEGGRG